MRDKGPPNEDRFVSLPGGEGVLIPRKGQSLRNQTGVLFRFGILSQFGLKPLFQAAQAAECLPGYFGVLDGYPIVLLDGHRHL